MGIEDRQNHARRAFENAQKRPQELVPEQKQGERKLQTLHPELKPKGLGGRKQQPQVGLEAGPIDRKSRIEDAYKKAKGGLTDRTIKQDFDRAR